MSVGDYQNFCLDLTDTGCVDEVIEAIIQRRVERFEDRIQELEQENHELTVDNAELQNRITEIVAQRTDMYEQ